jgi:hypothetical protein
VKARFGFPVTLLRATPHYIPGIGEQLIYRPQSLTAWISRFAITICVARLILRAVARLRQKQRQLADQLQIRPLGCWPFFSDYRLACEKF